jgi:hypothetical protein
VEIGTDDRLTGFAGRRRHERELPRGERAETGGGAGGVEAFADGSFEVAQDRGQGPGIARVEPDDDAVGGFAADSGAEDGIDDCLGERGRVEGCGQAEAERPGDSPLKQRLAGHRATAARMT